jgi:hypothetical protein
MTDQIEKLVERAIGYTIDILTARVAHWRVARLGLIKIADGIDALRPDHPALEVLRRFISAHDARFNDGAAPD